MKWIKGMMINLQFFTSIPIRCEISMDKDNINHAIKTFPILGLIQGLLYACILYLALNWTPFSSLAAAFFVWVAMIVITGGIHLDGWIDASDAYFSYQSIKKRLEIMKDPRTGAFGVLVVIVLLAAKFLFIYETVIRESATTYLLIAMIPLISKSIMGMLIIHVKGAKADGLGAYFKQAADKKTLGIYPIYFFIILVLAGSVNQRAFIGASILLVTMVVLYFGLSHKAVKWFGGITGDVVGASVEGSELVLWMMVWLLHYFVTV
ncbi:adenosylcobinamide-GDP ribazoletransferase [Sporolactobacillus sp. THM19-2]|uniref:adenosylcobinamide-GDP ribazoletransferase n=1 Tax=Sporolactobacillus sp. THM19-2 TaxID=2511171 RepID=UPI0010205311|nr:adenosylcobinamide-GDP ribazoletransferase [Sporolactobacillus sp. THM19-2]RYL88134.1 adenosylcobinamide-GDP ribazoletransferase [Sporolactobacillus sp. THM19-2]